MPNTNSDKRLTQDFVPNWRSDLVLAYALGNLVLLPFWFIAFARNGMPLDQKFIEHFYELSQIFDHVDYFAALLWGFCISIILFLLFHATRNKQPRFYSLAVNIFIIPTFAGALAITWYVIFPPSGHARINNAWIFEGLAVFTVSVAILTTLALTRSRNALRFIRFIISVTAPFGILMSMNAYVAYQKIDASRASIMHSDRSLAPLKNTQPTGPRVILIFFDYWDYHYTFIKHPEFVKTPNINKLTNIAFNGHNVARASSKTFTAIPSVLSGHRIDYAKRIGGDRLLTQYAAEYYPRIWNHQSTIFSDAHAAGYNTGVVATAFHPVCRIFPQFISRCIIDDHPFDYEYKTVFNRLDDVISHTLWQVPPIRKLLFRDRPVFNNHWGIHLKLSNINSLKKMAKDRKISFLYSHLFIPHAPNIWNSIKKEYMYENEDNPINYFHSIVFLDKVIGDLRKTLEDSGLWDETAVILTADTGNVGSQSGVGLNDYAEWGYDTKNRVPLIIKLPNQNKRVDLDRRVSAQTLRDVIQKIMSGELTSHDQISNNMRYVDYMY